MTDVQQLLQERNAVITASPLTGRQFAEALSEVTDRWLAAVFAEAVDGPAGARGRIALAAVGGYGRGLLAPGSDLDVVLLHDLRRGIDEVATRLWYPLWDSGVKLGHGVFTVKDAGRLAGDELDAATAQLTARSISGDDQLVLDLRSGAERSWRKRSGAWLTSLSVRVDQRHATAGEVAFLLEPDLKEGRGGLRDVQALRWGQAAGLELGPADDEQLDDAEDTLFIVRVALHRVTGRATDVLRLEDQDAVAAAAGFADADSLMAEVSAAGRTIAWIADETWARLRSSAKGVRAPADRVVAPGIELRDGAVRLASTVDPSTDLAVVFRVATAAARHRVPIETATLERLAAELPPFPARWPAGASSELVGLLLEGHAAIGPIESLDRFGLVVRVLPEWVTVRNKPQRNAYHRFTVDRHLLEAVANAAELADRVSRPDLLVLGALLHDLGKGLPGDHTDNGVILARALGTRFGLSADDAEVVVALVRHHLLLPDVATRRDLSDDTTISSVAETVESPLVLELLHALTEADSLATGTSAWGSWKAELVASLVERVAHVIGGGDVREVTWRLFPSAHVLTLMARGGVHVVGEGDRLITVAPDRQGLFSRVAGVLSLHGLDVLAAEAHSDEHGMAANELRVVVPRHGMDWSKVTADLERALEGQLAIEARLAERARTSRKRKRTMAEPIETSVRLDNDASSNATVVEVKARDSVGVLYRITKALAELALDIRHATVQTLGDGVVDTFYVRGADGKVEDPFHIREIERAVLHAVG